MRNDDPGPPSRKNLLAFLFAIGLVALLLAKQLLSSDELYPQEILEQHPFFFPALSTENRSTKPRTTSVALVGQFVVRL